MTALFFLFVGLAIYHFVWEGIIAPSLRIEIRYEFFKLRDELRKLKIAHGNDIQDELFDRLQVGINKSIRLLHDVKIEAAIRAYKEVDESDLAKMDSMLAACPVDEVREVYNRTVLYLTLAFVVNSGGWFVYIVPLLFVLAGFTKVKNFIRDIFSLSDNDINRIFPPRHLPT